MQPVATHELELVSGGGGKRRSTNISVDVQKIEVNQLAFNIGTWKSNAENTSVIFASN